MPVKYIAYILVALFSLGTIAHPPDPFLATSEAPSHRRYKKVPAGRSLTAFEAKKEYLIGSMGDMDVTLSTRPERNEERKFVRTRYLMTFYSKENLGNEKSSHVACTINFYTDEQNAIFKGILVHDKLRGQGLMKRFFKYFALFVDHYRLGISTEKMYKPMFAKLFIDFGFEPYTEKQRVSISRTPGPNDSLQVYPYGFDFRPALIQSQNMTILKEPPHENFQDVYVNTEYTLAPKRVDAFWAKLAKIDGEYVIFQIGK